MPKKIATDKVRVGLVVLQYHYIVNKKTLIVLFVGSLVQICTVRSCLPPPPFEPSSTASVITREKSALQRVLEGFCGRIAMQRRT